MNIFFFTFDKVYLKGGEITAAHSGIEWVEKGKVGERRFCFSLVSTKERERCTSTHCLALLSWARGVVTWYYTPVPVEGEYNLEKGSCHCQVGRLCCIGWGKVWFPVWESKLAISLSNFIPSWDFWPIFIRINERYRFISSCAASFCWLGV